MTGGALKRYGLVAALLAATLFGVAAAARAQARFYDIAPQPLEQAIIALAERARLSINYSGLDISGLKSPGSSRNVAASAALRAILNGTGIGFRFIDENTVELFLLPESPAILSAREDPAAAPDAPYIDELVVTAIKRPATGFELPVSVTGVSALELEDLGAYDFQSLAPHLAGVSTTNLGPGRNKIFVRGLSDGPFADRTQAIVGVYIDETPVTFSDTNPDLRLYDVERIELIRGPQGTLYGAGSLGGIYKVVTAKPELDRTLAKGRLSLSHTEGGGENGTLDLVINTPLVEDRLGFRVAGYTTVQDGYIDDIALGIENANDLSIFGIRPSLRWRSAGDWTVDAGLNVQSIRYDDSQYFQDSLGRNKRANQLQEPYDDDFIHGSVTVQGKLGTSVLTSATAFIDRTLKEAVDASSGIDVVGDIDTDLLAVSDLSRFGGAEDFFEESAPGAAGFFTRDDINTLTHETRLQSEAGGRLDWLAGVFYLGRRQTSESVFGLSEGEDQARIAFTEDRREDTDDIAAFGEVIWRTSDRFSLTGGLRFSHSKLRLNYRSVLATDGSIEEINESKTTNKVIPKIAMRYEWSDDVQTYAQASVGYRIGGININTPLAALQAADPDAEFGDEVPTDFQSDTLVNYELGLKSHLFDRRLSLNVAAFYVRWFDIQSDQFSDSGLPFVTNVGNARSLGYEIEVSANPLPGLELRGSLFSNEAELLDDNPFLGAEAGDRLPTIPGLTYSIAALYATDVASDWRASLSANYAYTSDSALQFNEDTSPQMGNYGILNAAIQLTSDDWKIGVFATNLTDTRANTFSFGNSFTFNDADQVTPPRPRTFGLFVERRF